MKLTWARTACSHPALSGVSRAHFGEAVTETVYRKQIRPVIQTGAVAMNRIFKEDRES